MPYLELSLRCQRHHASRYERALENVGALSITLQDAQLNEPDEQAIFEPGVGETPLWQALNISALFEAQIDALALLAALKALDPELEWSGATFKQIADQHWERVWMDHYQPMQFGERTWIVPWNRDLPEAARASDAAIVRLDPGLAFGSGTHPTTALCLQWLDTLARDGLLQARALLDFGCGSGVLALAALKLGVAQAVCIDNDPQALMATADNAQRNALANRLRVCPPQQAPSERYGIVVANILAVALEELAATLAARSAPGGRIALSGILDGQQAALLRRYALWFDALNVTQLDGWVRIDGIRKPD